MSFWTPRTVFIVVLLVIVSAVLIAGGEGRALVLGVGCCAILTLLTRLIPG